MENEKRILIIQVSGECRHLRVIDADCEYGSEGLYCAANPHSKEWEKISKKDCGKCKRDKDLTGITRQEAIDRLYHGFYKAKDNGALSVKEMLNGALSALLGEE